MSLSRLALALGAFLLGFSLCLAEEKPTADPAKPKPPIVKVVEVKKIAELVGKEATISGKVTRTGKSKSGIHFLNFANFSFVVVCFPDAVAKFKEGGPAELYRDQTIEVTGKIEVYRKKHQIKLASPDQIKIIPAAVPADKEDEDEKKGEPKAETAAKDADEEKPKAPVDPKRFFDC